MTFLEMVRTVRLLSGMQGTGPASTVDATGVEEVIVRMVRDAYVDIQNIREEWDWLNKKGSFVTQIGQSDYTLLDIFMSANPLFKKYDLSSFRIINSDGQKRVLTNVDREALQLRYMNDTSTKLPALFAVEESDRSLILKPIADAVYTVDFRYWRSPEILTTDTQIPLLPVSYHLLIVYKGLEKLAVYLSAPELFTQYSTETVRMQGEIMRMYNPKKIYKVRPLA